jgi:6-pyruvoyltetrahydropterin/6-carboxytetrahydropterin synthase
MLSGYEGKCANLHGHTYHGTVEINAPVADETRMVLDYNIIKEVVDEFDHAVVFSFRMRRNAIEEALYTLVRDSNMRYVIMPSWAPKSTAEDMAMTIAQWIKDKCDEMAEVTVKLSETDGSWAEVTI